jgi:EmrB/QacA subfamily drug resistance transporter
VTEAPHRSLSPAVAGGSEAGSPAGHRRAIELALILTAQLMMTLDATVVNVALPRIDTGLHFSTGSLSWVLNAYTLTFGGLLLLGGRLGDAYGRRRVMLTGLALFTGASLLGGFALSPAWLIATRAVQGVGAALAAPSALTLAKRTARDERERHRALALFNAVSVSGGSVGLVVGGLVTQFISWRWTLFINVPIGATVLLFAPRLVAEASRHRSQFDVIGAFSAVGAATGLVYAVTEAPAKGWSSPETITGFAVAAVLFVVLGRTESRVPDPVLRPALLRDRSRVASLTLVTLAFGAQSGMFFLMVQYVQRVLGLRPLEAGLAFLPLTLGVLGVSRVIPRLAGRFGARAMVLFGASLLTIGMGWLIAIRSGSTYPGTVFVPLLLIGAGVGSLFTPAAAFVVGGVRPSEAGAASGLLQTTQQLGGAIGLAIVASVYAAGASPHAFLPGLRPALATGTGLVAAGIAAFAVLARQRPPEADGAELTEPQPKEI